MWRWALLIALLASPAGATADGPDYLRVRDVSPGSVLLLRAGPSTEEPVLARIPHDADGLRNLGCVGGLSYAEWSAASTDARAAAAKTRWCQIMFDGQTGWAAGWHLGEGRAPDP